MGMVVTVTQTPTNQRCRSGQGTNAKTDPKSAGSEIAIMAPQMPPLYLETHYVVILPSPVVMVATAVSKVTPAAQCKNVRDIFNFINTQGNDLGYLNGEDTLFAALFSVLGTQQVKLFYGMRP